VKKYGNNWSELRAESGDVRGNYINCALTLQKSIIEKKICLLRD